MFVEDELTKGTKNTLTEIKEVWAFVSVDSDTNMEAIVAPSIHNNHLPLVCSDEDMLNTLRPYAEKLAKQFDLRIKLIKSTGLEIIEENILNKGIQE